MNDKLIRKGTLLNIDDGMTNATYQAMVDINMDDVSVDDPFAFFRDARVAMPVTVVYAYVDEETEEWVIEEEE